MTVDVRDGNVWKILLLYLSGIAASSVLMTFLYDVQLLYSDACPAGFHPHCDAFVLDIVDFVDAERMSLLISVLPGPICQRGHLC